MTQNDFIQNHFGLGKKVENDGAFSLYNEIEMYQKRPAIFANSPTSFALLQQIYEYDDEKRQDKEAAKKARAQFVRKTNLQEQNKRTQNALITKTPFLERMVHFWSNHFAISIDKVIIRPLGNSYESEAIRPNILGNFRDLLIASITHPAMLLFLDQAQSIGPNSVFAQRREGKSERKFGLNENLAREILELHTLGVHGGYSQKDVTEFAKALTGFTILNPQRAKRANSNAQLGQFYFEPNIHEPNSVTFMGKNYNGQNAQNAAAIIETIAKHPSTAQFIATKLARHFGGDEPPQALIDALKANFIANNGDLKALYKEIISNPHTSSHTAMKFKTPYEWLVSSFRAMNVSDLSRVDILEVMKNLGQELWLPKSPKGYDDIMDAWAAPDALLRRAETANLIAKYFDPPMPPVQLAQNILGPTLTEHTKTAISRAESVHSGIALFLICPEFLRR